MSKTSNGPVRFRLAMRPTESTELCRVRGFEALVPQIRTGETDSRWAAPPADAGPYWGEVQVESDADSLAYVSVAVSSYGESGPEALSRAAAAWNAALGGASPRLLAACEDLLAVLDGEVVDLYADQRRYRAALDEIRAAVTEATAASPRTDAA
jgi:hypothetical protein